MRPHVVYDKIKSRPLPTAGRLYSSFGAASHTATDDSGLHIMWSPTARNMCITDGPSDGQLGARQMWRKQGLLSYFLCSALFSLLALVLCCVMIVCLLGRVLISPTQSGPDDGHMSMYSLYTQ